MSDRGGESHADRRRRYVAEGALTLVTRIRAGDTVALEILRDRYVPSFQRFASTRVSSGVEFDAAAVRNAIQGVLEEAAHVEREGSLLVALRDAVYAQVNPLETSRLAQTIGVSASRVYEACLARLAPIEREAIICRIELGRNFDQLAVDLAQADSRAAHAVFQAAFVHLAEEMADGV